MNRWTALTLALCVAAGIEAAAQAPNAADEGAGALLYSTHCVGCHTAQVHWRDGKVVTNWAGLQAEVRRWQNNIGLGWSEDDIAAVARHLNAIHYHFPAPDRVAARHAGWERVILRPDRCCITIAVTPAPTAAIVVASRDSTTITCCRTWGLLCST